MRYIIIIFTLFLIGCSSPKEIIEDSKEVEIRDIKIEQQPPKIHIKELPAIQLIDDESNLVYFGFEIEESSDDGITKKDTVAKVKFYPKQKTFEIEIIPEKVDTTIKDTTIYIKKRNITTVKEQSFIENIGYVAIGLFLAVALAVILAIRSKIL